MSTRRSVSATGSWVRSRGSMRPSNQGWDTRPGRTTGRPGARPSSLVRFASVGCVTAADPTSSQSLPDPVAGPAFGHGLATVAGTDGTGEVLDVWYPAP